MLALLSKYYVISGCKGKGLATEYGLRRNVQLLRPGLQADSLVW